MQKIQIQIEQLSKLFAVTNSFIQWVSLIAKMLRINNFRGISYLETEKVCGGGPRTPV